MDWTHLRSGNFAGDDKALYLRHHAVKKRCIFWSIVYYFSVVCSIKLVHNLKSYLLIHPHCLILIHVSQYIG